MTPAEPMTPVEAMPPVEPMPRDVVPHRWARAGAVVAAAAMLCAAVLVAALLVAAPAGADQLGNVPGESTGNGYEVSVRLTGDAAPGGGGSTVRVRMRPSCWWAPSAGPYTDAKAMAAWFQSRTITAPLVGGLGLPAQVLFSTPDAWADAVRREESGQDMSWYMAVCRDPADLAGYVPGVTYVRAFPVAQPLPAPRVDPAELARIARDAMVIPVPVTGRNPRIRAAGAPTLVGLPTWFWVTDPAAVGGAAGTRTIRAQAGDVWAQVVAQTGGLRLRSPSGGAVCGPARATTRYAAGLRESAGCTVAFARASVAYPKGYPVTASTGWQATWTGSGGQTGTLDPLARTVTVNVPVAEVQNVVSGPG
jgi:hypothetical protein